MQIQIKSVRFLFPVVAVALAGCGGADSAPSSDSEPQAVVVDSAEDGGVKDAIRGEKLDPRTPQMTEPNPVPARVSEVPESIRSRPGWAPEHRTVRLPSALGLRRSFSRDEHPERAPIDARSVPPHGELRLAQGLRGVERSRAEGRRRAREALGVLVAHRTAASSDDGRSSGRDEGIGEA